MVGGDLTVDSPVEDFEPQMQFLFEHFDQRSRDPESAYYGTWQTIHSCVYDMQNKLVYIKAQERDTEYAVELGGNTGMKQLLQVGSSYNMPVKVFSIDKEEEVNNLPKNVPMGSYAELLDGVNGLRVFMLRKTADEPDNGEWLEI